MGFHAMDYSVSVLAYEKKGQKYGMSCAWGMQVDYDKLVFLLGSQSQTGKNVKIGDIIGVSVLDHEQKNLALHFGDNHSLETDKFKGIPFEQEGSAIIFPNSARKLICEVIDILHLKEIEEDTLLYVRIKKSSELGNQFLHYGDL